MGGTLHGCELAEFLVKRGRRVTIVDTAAVLGDGMINHLRLQLFWWFRQKGVTMISCSCWQGKTTFQEKLGHKPEPARLPIVNLRTREIKVLRFG